MKSLEQFSNKWWYQFLKVAYVFFFVTIALTWIGGIITHFRPVFNVKESKIICSNNKTLSLVENSIDIIDDHVPLEGDQRVRDLCIPDDELGALIKQTYPREYESYIDETVLGKEMRERYAGSYSYTFPAVQIPKQDYKVVAVYAPRNWKQTILQSVYVLIGLAVVYELLKRVFYYLMFATFFPDKPRRYLFVTVSVKQ